MRSLAEKPLRCHVAAVTSVDIRTIRRDNFRALVRDHWQGHRAVAADELDFSDPSLVTRYLGFGDSWKTIGQELARKIERVAGKEYGWLDRSHDSDATGQTAAPTTIEGRIAALPEPLRQYLMLELQTCESAAPLVPADFTKAPTAATRRSFQQWLNDLVIQRRRSA